MPAAPPAAPDLAINWNPLTETWANFKFARTNRTVFLSVLGISWFWFYGAMFLSQFPNYTKDVLGGGATLDQATATTNAYGEASDFVTLGTTTGTTTISATARNSSTTVSITALPGAAVALVPIGADSVAVPTGQTAQLTVRAVDQFGNVVPGVPIEWHTVDEARGWVICKVWNRLEDPGDGSVHQEYNLTVLHYAGDGQWSYEEDIYNPNEFGVMVGRYLKARRAAGIE